MVRKIVWDKDAILQLKEFFQYLKIRSLQSAIKIRNSITKTIQELPKHPKIYGLDRFKTNNANDYRAFENIVTELLIE